ncbi:MAG: glutamate--tRNA ligase family protein, partial [Eubacteriales bacterium]|nr:glutamate--tRNA ligase family protein [Eubacteriales bacterium]
LCSLEFENHRPLYDWVCNECIDGEKPRQIEFARMNLNYTLTSKRKCLQLVKDGIVDGWDDPRMATISGMRRRGYPAEAIRDFCEKIGVSKAYSVIDFAMLESCVRDSLNKNAKRAMAVVNPIKLVIDNYPEDKVEELEIEYHPDHEEFGSRTVPFGKELWIESDDFMAEPISKYRRLFVGNEVRLYKAYCVTCTGYETDENGKVTVVHAEYDPETFGGDTPDGRKVRGTIHWVYAHDCNTAEVRMYDRLFDVENPSNEEGVSSFEDNLNPNSLVVQSAYVERALKDTKPGERFQFMRIGYFCTDRDSSEDTLVFNRTVQLRDSFNKKK